MAPSVADQRLSRAAFPVPGTLAELCDHQANLARVLWIWAWQIVARRLLAVRITCIWVDSMLLYYIKRDSRWDHLSQKTIDHHGSFTLPGTPTSYLRTDASAHVASLLGAQS